MTSCAPDADIDNRYYGIGPDTSSKSKKKGSKRHTPKDKTPPPMSIFEDHMEGSPYKGEDLCPHCGYRRDSTVYCTVSHLHHGNDTPLTPTHRHGGTSPSKSKKKSRRTSKQYSRSPMNEDDNGPFKGQPEYLHGATYSIGDAMITVSAASSPHGYGDDETAAAHREGSHEAAAAEEATATQYYCYTDENGDTYYYAAEMQDTVPNSQHHAPAEEAAAAAAAAATTTTAEEELESHPQVYVYTYEDENGVQQTVMVQGEVDAEECEEDDDDDDDDRMMSDVARDGGSQQEDTQDSSKKKKKKRSFASTISNLFQRRNRRASRTDDSEDGEASSGAGLSAPASRQHTDPTSGLSHTDNVDEAVLATVEAMDPSERKKFEKERRRLVKDLEEHEKTHRSKLIKERRQYTEDLAKERRACMQNLRGDDGK